MELKSIKLKGAYEIRYYAKSLEVYDEKGNMIYLEDSNGKWKYDEKGNVIYYESSYGYWEKSEYNEKGNEIYRENSKGEIIDKRVKELTIEEIEKLLGYKIKIKGERK